MLRTTGGSTRTAAPRTAVRGGATSRDEATGGTAGRTGSLGSFLRHWWDGIQEDLDAALAKDPAATSKVQMALVSPGLHALWMHRVSHAAWQVPVLRLPARILSNIVRTVTGVEIHPAAAIGRRVFIDHGMGVVIGETAEVGDDVMMYHGVTLGGRSFSHGKRHPTVEAGVTIGAGARIIGPVTVGAGAQIGANAVVVKDVPAGHVAVGVPAHYRRTRPQDVNSAGAIDDIDPAIHI